MSARANLWLLAGVVALALIPFWVAPQPKTEEEAAQMFLGADGKAMDLIAEISPDYRPWFKPLIEPSSGEIASLLFSFQAALGAGVIGYYIGSAKTREKMRREFEAAGRTAETHRTPSSEAPETECLAAPKPESGAQAALIDPREAERADSGRAD